MHRIQSPRPDTDETIEEQIQAKGLKAPRVLPAHLDEQIASCHFFTAHEGVYGAGSEEAVPPAELQLLTFCVLVLRNGFTVTGESACASPENFDKQIGQRIAKANATQKLWNLLGFQLKQQLYEAQKEKA